MRCAQNAGQKKDEISEKKEKGYKFIADRESEANSPG